MPDSHDTHEARLQLLIDEIGVRLRSVCGHLPDEEREGLIRRIAERELQFSSRTGVAIREKGDFRPRAD